MSDLKQAVETLRRQLRFFHVGVDVDFHSMILGLSLPFIKLYRHLLCEYDNRVSLFLSSNNFLLSETEDHRFMESLYRICRDVFTMKPPLSLAQFLTNSFAGKKLKMAAEIVKAVGELQKDLCRKTRKKHGGLTLVCASSAGPGGICQTTTSSRSSLPASAVPQLMSSSSSQRASRGACGVGARRAMHNMNTIFLQPSQQNQLPSTRHLRPLIPPQQASTTLSPTADSKSLCANDPVGPDRLHRSKRGSSPSIAKDSLEGVKNDYLSGLLTNLNTLSKQLSQVVDRVAGIESRVFAIEQPIRETATNQGGLLVDKAKLRAKDKHDSYDDERAESHDIAGLSPDLADRFDHVHLAEKAIQGPFLDVSHPTTEGQLFYWRICHPQDHSSLSETSASVEINDPLLSSKPSLNASTASPDGCIFRDVPDVPTSGRYSPESIGLPGVSIHKEDHNDASTNPTTEAQAGLTLVHNPIFRQTFEQDASLCQAGASNVLQPFTKSTHSETLPQSLTATALHELNSPSSVCTMLQSKSGTYGSFPIMSRIESGGPGRGDLTALPKQPTVRFVNKDGLASIMERTNSLVDQRLKQQVNRILNM
ncbi:Centrosomal protein of 44 kDa [Taenia solium]|eukprot:TsM_000128300 transcript=TsM_000128300 gene=TsM_000128300